jgi:hypothetical protein
MLLPLPTTTMFFPTPLCMVGRVSAVPGKPLALRVLPPLIQSREVSKDVEGTNAQAVMHTTPD